MKLFILFVIAVTGGVASAEHLHSFLLGLYLATLAVGACYWIAFRSSRFPQLALALLICGCMAKLGITVAGVYWGVSQGLVTSPIIFALSYLFFSIVATYLWFKFKDYMVNKQLHEKVA